MKVIKLHKNQTELISRAANNSREAQHQLYQLFCSKMLSVCRMYIKDVHQAEEVMLTGFLKVFTNIHRFRNEGNFEGWIRRIMVREAISFLRGKKGMEFSEENMHQFQESANNVESGFEVEHIQSLIDALPEGYKAIFVMHAIEGYKHAEIAELLNIAEGTSKSQFFKARKMLQEKLEFNKNVNYGTPQI